MDPATIIELIGVLTNVAVTAVQAIEKVSADLKQNAELTPDQEAALDAHIAALKASPAWQVQP